ncbi:integrase core domain-containing protein [Sphingobium sp. AntQ-1]|uniref:integrase core domain-containing protein n=1 Tax=Sphingobium sp. AntQ-1 TaxID=2930091 RepID=UPI00234E695F|nr:integrase core domain-containing protein [Sphingobium sp. AntQ-1]
MSQQEQGRGHYIDTGKPQQNGFTESINAMSCLRGTVQQLGGSTSTPAIWRYDYNHVRPHSSLENERLRKRAGIFNCKILIMTEGPPEGG